LVVPLPFARSVRYSLNSRRRGHKLCSQQNKRGPENALRKVLQQAPDSAAILLLACRPFARRRRECPALRGALEEPRTLRETEQRQQYFAPTCTRDGFSWSGTVSKRECRCPLQGYTQLVDVRS
ncbi:unnamed protein product, partial [Ectocarpus sp. 12 AP-2014]